MQGSASWVQMRKDSGSTHASASASDLSRFSVTAMASASLSQSWTRVFVRVLWAGGFENLRRLSSVSLFLPLFCCLGSRFTLIGFAYEGDEILRLLPSVAIGFVLLVGG